MHIHHISTVIASLRVGMAWCGIVLLLLLGVRGVGCWLSMRFCCVASVFVVCVQWSGWFRVLFSIWYPSFTWSHDVQSCIITSISCKVTTRTHGTRNRKQGTPTRHDTTRDETRRDERRGEEKRGEDRKRHGMDGTSVRQEGRKEGRKVDCNVCDEFQALRCRH
jgi:hypothetical protein